MKTPHSKRKLNQEQAQEIRRRRKEGELYKVLAMEYGVSTMCIQRIASGLTYRRAPFLART